MLGSSHLSPPGGMESKRTRLATGACFCCAAGPLVAQESSIASLGLLPQPLPQDAHCVMEGVWEAFLD